MIGGMPAIVMVSADFINEDDKEVNNWDIFIGSSIMSGFMEPKFTSERVSHSWSFLGSFITVLYYVHQRL